VQPSLSQALEFGHIIRQRASWNRGTFLLGFPRSFAHSPARSLARASRPLAHCCRYRSRSVSCEVPSRWLLTMGDYSTESLAAAAANVASILPPTPVVYSSWLSQQLDAQVYLKLETLHESRAFKMRGAVNFLKSHATRHGALPRVVLTASGGSHGISVALAACVPPPRRGRWRRRRVLFARTSGRAC